MFNAACRGFTLLELMLAMLLSSVISYELINIAVALQLEFYRQQQDLEQLETLRLASYLFSKENSQNIAPNCQQVINHDIVSVAANNIVLRQCTDYHQNWQVLAINYFVARNSGGALALYQQPEGGNRRQIAENIVDLVVTPSVAEMGVVIWLLMRSAQAVYRGEQCYYFVDHHVCRHDGYRYLSWPVYVS